MSEAHMSTAMQASLTGRVGNLTPEQEAVLREFKSKLEAIGAYDPQKHSDHLLLRFLRARKFNLDNARKMWMDCEKWRREFGIEQLMQTFDFPEAAEAGILIQNHCLAYSEKCTSKQDWKKNVGGLFQ